MAIDLHDKANKIRQDVVRVAAANGAGHIAPSLSCVDVLVALYYRVMQYDPADPQWPQRDRLVFSKAHGCYALYAILADLGVIPKHQWRKFYTPESQLAGCMERKPEWGLEAGCGSLGHGLPIATGIAFGAKLQGHTYRTYCLLGDGELQEGTNWEAIQFAVKHELDNLTLIIDHNGLQAMDTIITVMDRDPDDLISRLQGFRLEPVCEKGHDPDLLAQTLTRLQNERNGVPSVLIAQTVKGFGLKCMENVPKFHFRVPTADEITHDANTIQLS